MAIALANTYEASVAGNALSVSFTVDDASIGDLLVVWVTKDDGSSGTVTDDDVFTEIAQTSVTNGIVSYLGRWVVDSAQTSFTITSDDSDGWAGVIERWTGVDTTTPIDVASTINVENTATPSSPTVTTTVANTVVVYHSSIDRRTFSAVPDTQLAIVENVTDNDTANCSIGVGYKAQASAGASGAGGFTAPGADNTASITIALNPAAVGGASAVGSGLTRSVLLRPRRLVA